MVSLASFAGDRVTRLLCARGYLLGLFGSLGNLHRLLGPPLAAPDIGIGLNRRELAFHSVQSGLLSLAFLAPALLLYLTAPPDSTAALALVLLLVVGKVAVVNPWLARVFFAEGKDPSRLRIPGLAGPARTLSERIIERPRASGANTVYFSGHRPFVGFGGEMNAWTIAIDTTVPVSSITALAEAAPTPRDLHESELYASVLSKVRDLGLDDVTVGHVFLHHGELPLRDRGSYGPRYRPPSPFLSQEMIDELDRRGEQGRSYMFLTLGSMSRDLLVTQFLRFSRAGKTVFCEFASHLVPPARKSLYALDRTFTVHPILYAGVGVVLLLVVGFFATLVAPVTEWWFWFRVDQMGMLFENHVAQWPAYMARQMFGGWFVYRVAAASFVLLLAFAAWRTLWWLVGVLGVALRVKHDFGLKRSHRERWSKGARLDYYDLQEVIRALKTHEKILIGALVNCLEEHGIDTSDFKESITAFINQGVINSGEIRGSVATKVKSMVLRKDPAIKRRGLRR